MDMCLTGRLHNFQLKSFFKNSFLSAGMEYHIPQLADICVTSLGHVHVDAAQPAQDYATHFTLPCSLRGVLACGTVYIRHEPH